jgi:hypothetical protein
LETLTVFSFQGADPRDSIQYSISDFDGQ